MSKLDISSGRKQCAVFVAKYVYQKKVTCWYSTLDFTVKHLVQVLFFSLALYFVQQDYLFVASVKVESHFYDKIYFY